MSNNSTVTLTTLLNGEQAREELKKLQNETEVFALKMRAARKAGDDVEAVFWKKKIDTNKGMMRTLKKEVVDVNYVLENLSKSNLPELRKALRTMEKQINSGVMKRGSKDWDMLAANIKKVRGEINKVNKEMLVAPDENNNPLMKMIKKTATAGAFLGNIFAKGAVMVGQMVQKVGQFISQSTELSAAAQCIDNAFNRIANKDYLAALRKQTKGLISDFMLMKSAVRADNFNIPLGQLGKMLEFAQNRARDTGESVDYLVESIVNGIGRKSPLILDNLGISTIHLQQEVKKRAILLRPWEKSSKKKWQKRAPLSKLPKMPPPAKKLRGKTCNWLPESFL